MTNQTILCETHKSPEGFRFVVYVVAYQQPTVVLREGTAQSRDMAMRQARQWRRDYIAATA